MLKVDILQDESLQEVVDKFISGILPHENYDGTLYTEVLINLVQIIRPEDLSMEYYVLISVLAELNRIKMSYSDYIPELDLHTLQITLDNNLMNLIYKPELRVKEWLAQNGYPNNLEVETVLSTASQKLYERTIELYNRCLAIEQDTKTVLSLLPALTAAFVNHVAETSLNEQATILNNSLRIGRKVYSGATDWLEYLKMIQIEISDRIKPHDEQEIHINSLEVTENLFKRLQTLYIPAGTYGIPKLDDNTPLLKHRLIVICANENVGKTATAIHLGVNVMLNGGKLLYMCGESPNELIYSKILSNYIYQKRKIFVTEQHIANKEECPEDKAAVINSTALEVADNESLILKPAYDYDKVYDELVADYEKYKFDMLVIDHSLALTGGTIPKENVGKLAIAVRDFKRNYPVCCVVNSHLSALAKEQVMKGKAVTVAPTKENGNLSGEADEVHILSKNELLDKQNLLQWQNYKRRGAPVLTEPIYIRKHFSVSAFEFDERDQNGYGEVNLSAEAAIKNLADSFDEEDEDEYMDKDDWTS